MTRSLSEISTCCLGAALQALLLTEINMAVTSNHPPAMCLSAHPLGTQNACAHVYSDPNKQKPENNTRGFACCLFLIANKVQRRGIIWVRECEMRIERPCTFDTSMRMLLTLTLKVRARAVITFLLLETQESLRMLFCRSQNKLIFINNARSPDLARTRQRRFLIYWNSLP